MFGFSFNEYWFLGIMLAAAIGIFVFPKRARTVEDLEDDAEDGGFHKDDADGLSLDITNLNHPNNHGNSID